MRLRPGFFTVMLCSILLPFLTSAADNPFLGKWSLYLPNGAGWLEVRQEAGYLDADILWRGGSVVPVSHVYLSNGKLYITRTSTQAIDRKNGRSHTPTTTIEFEVSGDQLIGKSMQPSADGSSANIIAFYGKRIPPLPPAPDLSKVSYGKSIHLFNGKDLTGWELAQVDRTNGWGVEDGMLVNDPVQKEGSPHIRYGNLRTTDEFDDFNLTLKVKVPMGSNSGVYLRGIYEIQVMDSYGMDLDNHHMGALYSRITPSLAAEKEPGSWQELDMTLYKRHLTVLLNGKKIIDNQPMEGVTGGALSADQFSSGPVYLQGDHGSIMYKDIVLKPILD